MCAKRTRPRTGAQTTVRKVATPFAASTFLSTAVDGGVIAKIAKGGKLGQVGCDILERTRLQMNVSSPLREQAVHIEMYAVLRAMDDFVNDGKQLVVAS